MASSLVLEFKHRYEILSWGRLDHKSSLGGGDSSAYGEIQEHDSDH